MALVIIATVGCGGASDDPRCVARQALRDAIRAVDRAESAERIGDEARVDQEVSEAERLIMIARRNLPASTTSSVERGMLEAAGYLDFIVRDYRASGAVDATLTQFASRELDRAPTPGESAPNC